MVITQALQDFIERTERGEFQQTITYIPESGLVRRVFVRAPLSEVMRDKPFEKTQMEDEK